MKGTEGTKVTREINGRMKNVKQKEGKEQK